MNSFAQTARIGSAIALIGLAVALGQLVFSGTASAQRDRPGWRHHDFWQPGWMRRHRWGRRHRDPDMRARMQRHWKFMHEGLPHEYDMARSNKLSAPEVIVAGAKLYADNCASCHGVDGKANQPTPTSAPKSRAVDPK